ncbi:MAG TPA: helix-turn-helix domain-containing protein [Pedobacter sp.]|uniref:helix-turn-helix domain-containing protein n=1 Tax=Pedobacter sp. TaxID=1411316 RepID=UPI002C045A77|nr:helix-turn-helix domain-containing protein [Pedobacter sp.]HMI03133.1 helix-turn-helix domain-containing protein [Pedobacter sp.]
MSYKVIQPSLELKDLVSHFWAGKWHNSAKADSAYFSTANTQTELAFGFHYSFGNTHPELIFSTILGHTENFRQFPMNGMIDLFGVSLFSHAIPLFFDISTSDLTNEVLDVEDLLNGQGQMINEKLTAATDAAQRVKILTDFFKSQLAKRYFEDKAILNAINQIRQLKGIIKVSCLATESCLSQKQFERRFMGYTGFNPKLYSRIIRFETAVSNSHSYDTLTEIAYDLGYHDQAHFIHEFKKFSGFSPNKFLSLTNY